jgi:hypothetical protein
MGQSKWLVAKPNKKELNLRCRLLNYTTWTRKDMLTYVFSCPCVVERSDIVRLERDKLKAKTNIICLLYTLESMVTKLFFSPLFKYKSISHLPTSIYNSQHCFQIMTSWIQYETSFWINNFFFTSAIKKLNN